MESNTTSDSFDYLAAARFAGWFHSIVWILAFRFTPGFMLSPAPRASTRNDRQAHERRMCSVVQNPLAHHDVAGVAFVISASVQIAVVFGERRGGDDDAQTMSCGDDSGCEPQIDVVLVSLAGLEERGPVEAFAETCPHDAVLDALCTPVRVDVLHHDVPVRVLPLSGRPECRGHWSSDLGVFREKKEKHRCDA